MAEPWYEAGFPDQQSFEAVYGRGATSTASNAGPGPFGAPAPTPSPPPTQQPSPAPPPPPAPTPATGPTALQRDSRQIINNLLNQYGLGSLSDWAWGLITTGASPAEVQAQLRQRPEFGQRFPGIAERERRGLPPISPGEYVSYENAARQLFHAAALPSGFYDSQEALGRFIGDDVSVAELSQRISNGYSRVAEAPQAVRDAFASYFGAAGPGALAALFLDPNESAPHLEAMADAAMAGGIAAQSGIHLSQAQAMDLGEQHVTDYRLHLGFGQLASQAQLFSSTIGERGTSITALEEGVQSVFDHNAEATAEIEQRRQARIAAFQGAGGAAATQSGVIGLGSARPG